MSFGRVKHFVRLLTRPEYRKKNASFRHLQSLPRYTQCTTDLLGPNITVIDAGSFLYMYNEIFERQIYRFKPQNEEPYIIDGGANIGLSVLYFKTMYPHCRVVAFEPDQRVFNVLQENICSIGADGVELINKALWSSNASLDFMAEGADAGRVLSLDTSHRSYRVESTSLTGYLSEPVDFLKLDIEGAETEVILSCQDLLHNVKNIFVEYHSFSDLPQTLHEVLEALHLAGFRLHIHPCLTAPQPLYDRQPYLGMDMQLNIFGYRN